MGYWGVGPYENDDALDIKGIWEDYVPSGESCWSEDKVYGFFKRVYYKGSLPVVSDGNSNELIALGQMFVDNQLNIPIELKNKLASALGLELQKDRLIEWGEQGRKRANVLKKIAKKHEIELELKKPVKESSKYHAEIQSLNHWFDNIDRVNSLLESMSLKTIEWVESIKPDFIQSIEDSTWGFGDESDEDNAAELANMRYLAVIWFAFFNLKYKPDEIKRILDEVQSES
jgi:hypothetical protein